MFYDVTRNTARSVAPTRQLPVVGVVLHTTDGVSSLDWLAGGSAIAGSPASADFLIARNGDCFRIIGKGKYGYHAGKSNYKHYRNDILSQSTIGIELENDDTNGQSPVDAQYDTLGALLTQLRNDGELPRGYFVVGHGNVALPCGRRCDPVRFDWARIVWPL